MDTSRPGGSSDNKEWSDAGWNTDDNSRGEHSASRNAYTREPQAFGQAPSYTAVSMDKAASPTSAHARARRKSLSMGTAPLPREEDDDDVDAGYGFRKRRSRAGSFTYLPFHGRRRLSNAGGEPFWSGWSLAGTRSLRRRVLVPAGLVLAVVVFIVWHLVRSYEIQLEFSVFSHSWVASEFDHIEPLKGCFNSRHISPEYNMTAHKAGRHHMLSPGLSLRRGMTCYDYASTIQQPPDAPLNHLLYHSYWRSDLMPFGDRQAATLTAFLATQPLDHSKMILWSNGADILAANKHLSSIIAEWPDHIEIRQVDMTGLTRGTELEGKLGALSALNDERGWVDGDAIRLLVLYHHGGVWMDMDQVLTRDLHPLTESEFVTQWDCYDKPYFQMNGALMHFQKHSPYLCEAFHIMASSPLPKPNSFTWGSHLYSKLHRRLIANHIVPFAVLPWCFSDPRNCRSDIRFPDPFAPDPSLWGGRRWDGRGAARSGREVLEEKMGHVWTVHLHNQWNKKFPTGGWMDKLMSTYADKVVRLQAQRRGGGEADTPTKVVAKNTKRDDDDTTTE